MNPSAFHLTRWTMVLRAAGSGPQAEAALSDLCAAYYEPVVAFLRRKGRHEDDARETAHSFFAFVLAEGVGTPQPDKGRFRSYLLGSLKHFLQNQYDAAQTWKRGGRADHVPLMPETQKSTTADTPGAEDDVLAFDREWAFILIERALATLAAENAEKALHFNTLKPWLDGGAEIPQSEAARSLGMTENAVKVAIHRLRTRFREVIREEVAATVNDPAEVADELHHLVSVTIAAQRAAGQEA